MKLEFTSHFLEDSRKFMMSSEKAKYIYNYLGLKKHKRVLDLGCGTGHFSRLMSQHMVRTGQVIGIDLNIKLLQTKKINKNIVFQCCDAVNLPYPDGTFDFTISHFLLSRINEKDAYKVLREMFRVTKRGGVIATFEPCLGGMTAFFPGNEQLSSKLRQIRLAKSSIEFEMYGINENIGIYIPEILNQIGTKKIKSELLGLPYWSPPPFPVDKITPQKKRWYRNRLLQFQHPNDRSVINRYGLLKDASSSLRMLKEDDVSEELLRHYEIHGISQSDLIKCQLDRAQYIQDLLENKIIGWAKSFEMMPILIVSSNKPLS